MTGSMHYFGDQSLIKKVRPVVDTAAHVAERKIKALPVGHGLGGVAEVPLSDMSGSIAI